MGPQEQEAREGSQRPPSPLKDKAVTPAPVPAIEFKAFQDLLSCTAETLDTETTFIQEKSLF